jgi:hypothetical protein
VVSYVLTVYTCRSTYLLINKCLTHLLTYILTNHVYRSPTYVTNYLVSGKGGSRRVYMNKLLRCNLGNSFLVHYSYTIGSRIVLEIDEWMIGGGSPMCTCKFVYVPNFDWEGRISIHFPQWGTYTTLNFPTPHHGKQGLWCTLFTD